MSNIEKYPKCHMRTSLGNCDPIGGFCTSVNTDICEALHKVADRPTGKWVFDECGYFHCEVCGRKPNDQNTTTDYCPHCGARLGGDTE